MSSIGAIGSYGGSSMDRSMPLAAKLRKKLQDNGGKTEQQLHFEKAKEMAELNNQEESLHVKLTREALEKADESLHLKLTRERNEKPAHLDASNVHARLTEEAVTKSKQEAASEKAAEAVASQSSPAKQAMAAVQGDPAQQATAVDAPSTYELGEEAAVKTHNSRQRAAAGRFDPTSFANQGAEALRRQREVEAYDPAGHAVRASGLQPGALLNVFA